MTTEPLDPDAPDTPDSPSPLEPDLPDPEAPPQDPDTTLGTDSPFGEIGNTQGTEFQQAMAASAPLTSRRRPRQVWLQVVKECHGG